MKSVFKHIHRNFYFLMVFLLFCLFYPLLYLFSKNERYFKYLNSLRKITAFISSLFSGIIYKYDFKEEVDWKRTYIVCANHTSNLDIFSLCLMMKNDFFFMGKEELLSSPITAAYLNTVDVPVSRKSKMSAYRAFKKTEERLMSGKSLIIFPEGLIGEEYPPVLHPFKNGPFKLAIEKNIPILPVSIIDTWEKMWDDGGKKGSKPGICHIYIHPAIETDKLTTKDEENLKNNVFEIVHSALNYDSYKKSIENI